MTVSPNDDNASPEHRIQELTKELSELREQQGATAEILRVISSSPNELEPVLEAIMTTARKLCQAERAIVWRLEGETFRAVAHHGQPEERVESVLSQRRPLSRESLVGRALLARKVVQVDDVTTDAELVAFRAYNRTGNIRTVLAVPLLLKGDPIGVITLARTRVAPFDDKQVALVQSFADQAVIAIENTRLFEAEQTRARELIERTQELTQTLEYQTATSDILRVISSSPTNVQPVFNAIAEAALRLCGAPTSLVTKFDGELLHLVAQAHISPQGAKALREVYPHRLSRGSASGRAILTRAIVQIRDVMADPEYQHRQFASAINFRGVLVVPMICDGRPIGTINVHKVEPGIFSNKQIALLETFADQASSQSRTPGCSRRASASCRRRLSNRPRHLRC